MEIGELRVVWPLDSGGLTVLRCARVVMSVLDDGRMGGVRDAGVPTMEGGVGGRGFSELVEMKKTDAEGVGGVARNRREGGEKISPHHPDLSKKKGATGFSDKNSCIAGEQKSRGNDELGARWQKGGEGEKTG